MLRFTATRTISAPADRIWAVLANYERDPEWREGVETMAPSTPGPARVGTTTDEVLRLGGRTFRNHGEVVAVDEGRCLEWRTTQGTDAEGSRRVDPFDDGSATVTLRVVVRPHGIERLLAPYLRRVVARGLEGDLGRLAALVGAEEAADGPAVPAPAGARVSRR